jgi:LPS-assembly protein
MEMFGYPMFYTPYLSHPTPDAAAKTGLLTPSYTTNIYFGSVLKAPFYWRIDQDKDVVLTPWITATEGPLLQWDYKQLRDEGDYDVQGSITNPQRLNSAGNRIDGNELRGHIFAKGVETVGDDQQVGFNIQRTTDDTYLRRYGFGDQQALFSTAYYEYAQGRNLGLVSGLGIQGLRSTDRADTTPLVLPIFQGYYEAPPTDSGVKLSMAGDAQWLTRNEGVSQRRTSISPSATLPMVSDGGQIFTASMTLRQDFYDTQDVKLSNGKLHDGTTTRTLPQAGLEWRYPLVNTMENGSWVVEPVVLNVLQTNGGNPDTISNEDSKLIELSDTNIFSLDRMPGLDLYDSGSRLAYGFRSQYYGTNGINLDGLLGQNYSFNSDTPFPNSTRQGEQFSDYIGRIAAGYSPFSLSYRFAVDSKDSTLNRNEIGFNIGKPWLSLTTSYRSLKNNRYLPDSQEGVVSAVVALDDNWSLYGGGQRDLEIEQMVSANAGILYKNECFNIVLDGLRSYARDRDIQPTTEFTFRVGFKNLGEFGGK